MPACDRRKNAGKRLCKKEQLTAAVSPGIRGGIVCVPQHTREETCLILQPGRPRRHCPVLNAITNWRSHVPATRPSCAARSAASGSRWNSSSARQMKPWNASSKACTSTASRREPASEGSSFTCAGAIRRRACNYPAVRRCGYAAGRMMHRSCRQEESPAFPEDKNSPHGERTMRAVFISAERGRISRGWAGPGWHGRTRPPAS